MSIPEARLVQGLEYGIVDGLVVFLCRKTGTYVGGNRLTTDVFELLLESPSVERLYSLLESRYDVDSDTLRSDVAELLSKMAELELLELKEAPK